MYSIQDILLDTCHPLAQVITLFFSKTSQRLLAMRCHSLFQRRAELPGLFRQEHGLAASALLLFPPDDALLLKLGHRLGHCRRLDTQQTDDISLRNAVMTAHQIEYRPLRTIDARRRYTAVERLARIV